MNAVKKLTAVGLSFLVTSCAQMFPDMGLEGTPSTAAQTTPSSAVNRQADADAARGDAHAQYNLGMRYLLGVGAPHNNERALYWFTKSAEQGNAYAQEEMGYLYAEGKVIPRDFAVSLQWYQKAANQKLASAQYSLGVMYMNGLGVATDKTIANQWLQKSAAQGFAPAKKVLNQ